jgi:16S rRNA (adenine1518-N6/adenine1519-N6)-dimethyltransferase
MAELGQPKNTIDIIKKYNFRFRKKFGQNFLIDTHVLEKIAAAAEIGPEDCVLEIGPGIGTLTQVLAEHAGQVVAVEIDPELIPILQETLGDYPNAEVIHNDILKTDLQELSEKYNEGRPFSVVANLPYYITTPIVMTLLEKNAPVKSITVMVQKEVAERMQAQPGGKEYGALSLAVQYYAEAEIVANVPPNCFIPRPNVGSCVIRLRRCEKPRVETKDPDRMFRIIRAAFNQRRKTLANSVGNAGIPGCSAAEGTAPGGAITREAVTAALREMGLSETIRGEALSLEQFAELSDRLG